MLAKLCDAPGKWDTILGDVKFSLNNTRCRNIDNTPSQVLFGIDQLGVIKDEIRVLLDPYSDDDKNLVAIRDRAANIIENNQRTNINITIRESVRLLKRKATMIYNTDVTPGINM